MDGVGISQVSGAEDETKSRRRRRRQVPDVAAQEATNAAEAVAFPGLAQTLMARYSAVADPKYNYVHC